MSVLNLARSYTVKVAPYAATAPTSGWTAFNGINDFTYAIAATLQSTDTYETDGWASSEKTMQTWSATVKAFRPIGGETPAFDAGQEIVRAAQDQFGTAARVWVQFYNKDGLDEAWQGIALVDWSQSKSAVADVQEITVKFTGDGVLNAITNPAAS